VVLILGTKRFANLLANPADVAQIQIAIRLAGCANTDKRQVGFHNSPNRIRGGPNPPRLRVSGEDVFNLRFDDRRVALIDEVNLNLNGIYADYFMVVSCQTSGANGSDVSQTKYTYFHAEFLSGRIDRSRLWGGLGNLNDQQPLAYNGFW